MTEAQDLRIAAIQMNSTSKLEANLKNAKDKIKTAAGQKAQFIALPENFALLAKDFSILQEAAKERTNDVIQELRTWAEEFGVWLLGGTIPMPSPDPNRVFNTSLLLNPNGEIVARYDKIHLFDVQLDETTSIRESDRFYPGSQLTLAETPWGAAGLSICYDIRFPELFRTYAEERASLLFIPSAFTPRTGKAHWDILTRARAIENQAFVVAPAQTGEHFSSRRSYGHSRIISPWGEILAEAKEEEAVLVAQCDLSEIDSIRSGLPALDHRRLLTETRVLDSEESC